MRVRLTAMVMAVTLAAGPAFAQEAGDSAAFAFNTVVDTRRCEINTAYCPAGSVAAIISAGWSMVDNWCR